MVRLKNITGTLFLLLPAASFGVMSLDLGMATSVDRYGYDTATQTPTVGSEHVFRGIHTDYDVVFQVSGIKTGVSIVGGPRSDSVSNGIFMDIQGLGAYETPWVTFRLKVIEANSFDINTGGTLASLQDDLRVQAIDIDSNRGQNFSDYFGYNSTSTPDTQLDFYTDLKQDTFNNGVADFTIFRLDPALNNLHNYGNPKIATTAGEPNNAEQSKISVNMTYSDTTFDEEFIWGAIGSNSNTNTRGLAINMAEPAYIDVNEVPEPATAALLMGLLGLAGAAYRRMKR